MVRNPNSFKAMLDALKAAGREPAMEDALTAMPHGYAEAADAWYADYLKLQSLVAREVLPKSIWKLGATAARFTLDRAPLIQFARSTQRQPRSRYDWHPRR